MLERRSDTNPGEATGPNAQTLNELFSTREATIGTDHTVARNGQWDDPCPCDSGKKYEQCHGGNTLSTDLVQAVTKMNPEFHKLDGILTGLAEACLNPARGETVQVIGVCSAQRGEGKTTVSLGLATALARRIGKEILLVEADLANPTLAEDLQGPTGSGFVESLGAEEIPERAIQPTPVGHLAIMTAGQAAAEPFSILDGGGLRSLLRLLRDRFRYIVLDMPAILDREESGRLIEVVDGVVMVIEAGRSSKEVTEAGIAAIGEDRLLGVVLNRAWSPTPSWISKILSTEQGPTA